MSVGEHGDRTAHAAGEGRAQQDDGDDIVLRIITVAEESGVLDDECQAPLWQVLTGDGDHQPERASQRVYDKTTHPAGAPPRLVTSCIQSNMPLTGVVLGGTTGMMCVRQDEATGVGTRSGTAGGTVLAEEIDRAYGHRLGRGIDGRDL